jgi:predicted Fe-Mo cluster-binding NifX family protein
VKVALPLKDDSGLEAEVLPTFEGAPFVVVLSKKGEDEVEVNLYKNPAQSLSEVAQVLLAYGVKRVVLPEVNPLARSALEELGFEVVEERFKTLKEALYSLF